MKRTFEMLRELEGPEPSTEEKLLLGTDGSVTFLLEVLTGEEAEVETLEQKVEEVGPERARVMGSLNLPAGSEVNFRRVLLSSGDASIYAESWTPLARLEPFFIDDLLREDKPIGIIMAEHGIEARRDIKEMGVTDGVDNPIFEGEVLFYREYDIVRNGEVMIHIREEFPSNTFD